MRLSLSYSHSSARVRANNVKAFPKMTKRMQIGWLPLFHKSHIDSTRRAVHREDDYFLYLDLFWAFYALFTLNDSNLVQTRSVKVGGLCVVAVAVGQDHCWMMPCGWQQWTDQNQFHTLTWNVFYSERWSCNGKKTSIAHCGTEGLTESFLSRGDAFTPALPHPVTWNGVNSQICH